MISNELKVEKRGGLRSPAGGRPPMPKGDRKVKVSITISPETKANLHAHRIRPNEPLSQVIERLLHSLPEAPDHD